MLLKSAVILFVARATCDGDEGEVGGEEGNGDRLYLHLSLDRNDTIANYVTCASH